jgi:hypothetical protein
MTFINKEVVDENATSADIRNNQKSTNKTATSSSGNLTGSPIKAKQIIVKKSRLAYPQRPPMNVPHLLQK